MKFATLTPADVETYDFQFKSVDPTWPLDKLKADRPGKWELSFVLWDHVPIAYCVLTRHERFGTVHIGNLAVHPDFRGWGFGDRVMREAVRRGAQSVKVDIANTRAQKLYIRHGFCVTGLDNGYLLMTGGRSSDAAVV